MVKVAYPAKKWRRFALWGAVGLTALGVGIWTQRKPIARQLIESQLREAQVPARFTIRDIGSVRQRIESISLGDPRNPDLTADWAEIDLGMSRRGMVVKAIRAGNVRVRGRLVDGKLSLGALDRLLPKPDGTRFRLPDIDLALGDGRMRLDTPYGAVGGWLTGKGNLASGFAGMVAISAPQLANKRCRADNASLFGALKIVARQPELAGPLRVALLDCAGMQGEGLALNLKASVTESLDQWAARGTLSGTRVRAQGVTAQALGGDFDLGGKSSDLKGRFAIKAQALGDRDGETGRATVNGQVAWRNAVLSGAGQAEVTDIRPAKALLASASRIAGAASGTPVTPLSHALARAVSALARGSAARADWQLGIENGGGMLVFPKLVVTSQSGAQLASATPLMLDWHDRIKLGGALTLAGGGFPEARVDFDGSGLAGQAVMKPYAAGGARLALTPLRFALAPRGFSLATIATLDGPLGDGGRIRGLRLPIDLRPGAAPLQGCLPIDFARLEIANAIFGATRLRACIDGKQAALIAPQLSGTLDGAPLSLAAGHARIGFAHGDLALDRVTVQLGSGDSSTRFTLATLAGALDSHGARGRFAGAGGALAGVPLLISEAGGDWQLDRGRLALNGGLRLADANAAPRFLPLSADDFALSLIDGRIHATATAREPKSAIMVTRVTIDHDLATASGGARLDVPMLNFGQSLQPEALTPITIGVIALVDGALSGQGRIDWTKQGVTSSGEFTTQNMDLAAAFGPVTGLSGTIHFSDLLGLETPPGQKVSIGSINPGIAVLNGEISYQLRPELKAQIEGGAWPFSGGMLRLRPSLLDLSESAERRLTLGVEGLDVARFIAAMEFENIAATGKFDGELPMIFDANGGRIEGGNLVARSGGTLSYVGQVSNENLGVMGRFAFDALKSMRYDRLSIGLDGAIDGDVITRISFAGINQAPITGVRTKLPIRILGLDHIRFIFNVTITAKFRQLFEMSRSFTDPSVLINRIVPQFAPEPVTPPPPVVQQQESSPTP